MLYISEEVQDVGFLPSVSLFLASIVVGAILGLTIISGIVVSVVVGFSLRYLTYEMNNSVSLICVLGIGFGVGNFLTWNYLQSQLYSEYVFSFLIFNSKPILFFVSAGMADVFIKYKPYLSKVSG